MKPSPFCQRPLEPDILTQSLTLDPFMAHDLIPLSQKCGVEIFSALGLGGGCHWVILGSNRALFNSQFKTEV
jgi:hypothetical protein